MKTGGFKFQFVLLLPTNVRNVHSDQTGYKIRNFSGDVLPDPKIDISRVQHTLYLVS